MFKGATLTGKGLEYGGSILRPEATGYGALYFVHHMLDTRGIDIKGKTIAVSGFGNVAWGAVQKATQLVVRSSPSADPMDTSTIQTASAVRRTTTCWSSAQAETTS